MTKKQNRSFGFGKRTLSVVLALMMILSLLAVGLVSSVTAAGTKTITVGVINYLSGSYQVHYWGGSSGDGDANLTSKGTTEQRSVGSSYWNNAAQTFNMYTAQIPSDATGFKVRQGNTWFGSSDGNTSTQNAAYIFEYGGNYNAVYVKVADSDPDPDPDPTPAGADYDYEAGIGTTNGEDIFWANAYYYDYLSDAELPKNSGSWLNPIRAGTNWVNSGKDSQIKDEWYPFTEFNANVVKSRASSSWTPLYFGNFCNTFNAYDNDHHQGQTPSSYNKQSYNYMTATNTSNFDYAANNSNGVYDMYTSVQGLMADSLNDGKLQTAKNGNAGPMAPYFDKELLGDYAKVVKSKFPFRKEEKTATNGSKYMRYEFDSTNATDNVYFTWNGTTPTQVNYGGTSYGVKDGIYDFMTENSGYGLFPFNNKNGGNGGNNVLDYGFGIRMDMKFRVPNSTDVKFDFSGDDDLWMYITDDEGNSQLVLDMGGSHKMSTGVVDFAPNGVATATVDKVDNRSASNKDLWVEDVNNGWGNVKVYASSGNGQWYWFTGQKYDKVYRFRDNLIPDGTNEEDNPPRLGDMTTFKLASNTSWSNQYPSGSGNNLSLSSYTGSNKKVLKTDGGTWSDNSIIADGHSESRQKTYNFDHNKTYTMTIFYMERGLLESNCKMGFTITPLGNNFIVTEEVKTANVNAGIREEVKDLSKFGFKTYNNGSQISDSYYKDFTLYNNGREEIGDSILPINSNVRIEQYAPDTSYLKYSSSWTYTDNASSKELTDPTGSGTVDKATGATTSTSTQTLINKSGDTFDWAELQVDYVNIPEVGSFSVEKQMAAGSTAPADKTFPATIYLQFTSDSQPAAYTLYDNDNNECTNGRVNLVPGQTISFSGIPTGTRVYVVEDSDQNYTASYNFTRTNPYIVGTSSGNITVTNTPNDSTPTTAVISGTKKFDDTNYTGTLFNFVLEGVPRFSGDPSDIKATTDYVETTVITNGVINFGTFHYTEPGTYRYHVYEDMSYLEGVANDNSATYDTDIFNEQPDYLVSVTVRDENFQLVADPPVYYEYSRYEADGTTPHTMSSADFSTSKVDPLGMIFYNEVKKGSITIHKTNQKNQDVNSVVFQVYPVSDEFVDELNALTNDEDKYNKVFALGRSDYGTGTGPDYSFEDGIAEIGNLPIYQTGYQTPYAAPKYQQYVMIETNVSNAYVTGEPDAKYNLNKTVHVFSFPMEDQSTHEMKYHLTYDYVNGVLKTPNTAGSGMTMFKIIGSLVAVLGVLSLGGYVIYTKRSTKRKTAPKHAAK